MTIPHKRLSWEFVAMVAVLLLAAYLRIHDLNAQGIWGDEGWSVWLARGDTLRDLTMTMVFDHHGPVYSALLRGWELLAGPTVLALRWITVLFSIASIALIYPLGRALFNPAAGVGAALAFTLMDKHVVLTQEIRDYPMIFFMMIAIALSYLRWRQGARWAGLAFVLSSVVGLYLHYYVYMVNLAIGAHALLTLRGRRAWQHFLALNGLILVAFAPWLPVVVHQFVNTPVDSAVLTIHGMPFNRDTIDYLAHESLGTPLALYGMLLLAGALGPLWERLPGSMARLPRARRTSGALFGVLWFAVPLLITWVLHTRYPLITDRNISVIMPGIALLVGAGFILFERYGALFLAALVLANGLLTTSSFYHKPPWREMAADIATYSTDDEPVLIDVEGAHAALWYQLTLALPVDVQQILNLLPAEAEDVDRAVSLYDLRKRYQRQFVPHLQGMLAHEPGLWLAYWGDEAKKHDAQDVLAEEGFVRTGTLAYEHLGNPIYAYRYDRISALQVTRAQFGDVLSLRRTAYPGQAERGEALPVLLWWHANAVPKVDYTVSVFLLDASGRLRAQHDSYPANGAAPTSGWAPDSFVFDPHVIQVPSDLPRGTYTLGVKLYTWWDGAVLRPDDGAEYVTLGTVEIK